MNRQKISNCVFCHPNADAVFLESGNFVAFYNIAPVLPGHSLVVPKWHVESLMELDDGEVAEFMIFGRKVAKLLLKAFKTSAFNWTIQEKEPAGQTIPHLHMHIIPRSAGDLPHPGDWYPLLRKSEDGAIDSAQRPKLSEDQMRQIVSHLRKIR